MPSFVSTGTSSASSARRRTRARSPTSCAIFVPDGVTRWSNIARGDVLLVGRQLGQRAVDVVADDLLGAAEPAQGPEPERARAGAPLLVPQPLHDELEVRRLDPDRAVAALDRPAPGLADLDLAGDDLLEHRVDELRLDLDALVLRRRARCSARDRLDDRGARRARVEVLEAQVVAEHVRDPRP